LWAEVAIGGVTGLFYVVTPFRPDWIEAISGWDPDQHKGSVEWIVVVALLAITLAVLDRFP
jgi:hypothetical protein